MGLIVAAYWTLVYLNLVMLQVSNKHLVFYWPSALLLCSLHSTTKLNA